jgi:type IV pilus assembly protein PilM
VIVKKITMPQMDKNLVKEQIRFEAEQYIPFDINNISIDFHVLEQSSSPDTIEVLLIAAQNELVSQFVTAVEFAKLKCEVLDVAGFALANCFEANYGKMTSGTIGLLNIGASIINFAAINNGEVIFTRDIPVGGVNYTSEIQKGMGVTFEEAEALKIDAISQKEVPDEVHSIINSTTETMVEEVRNTFDFLVATSNGVSLSKCYYTGGAAGTTGLVESLTRTTGIPFDPFDPFLRIQPNLQKISPMYVRKISSFAAISVGLAYRMAGDS